MMMTSISAQAFFERYEQVKSIEQSKNELIEVARPFALLLLSVLF